MRRTLAAVLGAVLLVATSSTWAAASEQQTATTPHRRVRSALPAAGPAERTILAALPPAARIAYQAETGQVRYLGGRADRPLFSAAGLRALTVPATTVQLTPVDAARAFLRHSGPLFGLDGPLAASRDLQLDRVMSADRGRSIVRFQQHVQGVPVLGGQLNVQVSARGDIVSVAGELLPAEQAPGITPLLTAQAARQEALLLVERETGVRVGELSADAPELWIHDPRILGGPGIPRARLTWGVDVSGGLPATSDGHVTDVHAHPPAPRVSEMVLVDAATGVIAESISRLPHGLTRRICDFQNVPREEFQCLSPYRRVEGQGATGIAEVDRAYRHMGQVYRFYKKQFGRDSLDGQGMPIVATVRYCSPTWCPMRNAFWDWEMEQATFGDGWAAADDLVGHEYNHGVLDHGARLFYHYQSGSINESLSDIFGELIDLTNGTGDDRSAQRWLVGEDLLGTPILRDMQHPPAYGDPDRVRSSLYYTGPGDEGGVHSNSGIPNKAAALLADGGYFNGRTVTALGLTKTAAIFYDVMVNGLTSAGDFADLFDALQQACVDLQGVKDITATDCKSVRKAVLATEMDQQPPGAVPKEAPVCGPDQDPVDAFYDRLEDPESGNWAPGAFGDSRITWYYPQNSHPYSEWDATWASSGVLNLFGDAPKRVSDSAMALSAGVELPPEGAYLRFEHGYAFDYSGSYRYDGGLVEYSVDGGDWLDARTRFTHGGYNGTLFSGRGNPLAGRRAFTARSYGYAAARIDFTDLGGRSLRIRFRTGTDDRVAGYGWYVDDVRIYHCAPA
ncbi:MAG: M4 family metallopeptidase [Chloroflexota bacterium]|nr:M4 family metallopeptidase [Chloroflexota bacterium]